MAPVCPCWWHLEISDVRPSQAPWEGLRGSSEEISRSPSPVDDFDGQSKVEDFFGQTLCILRL